MAIRITGYFWHISVCLRTTPGWSQPDPVSLPLSRAHYQLHVLTPAILSSQNTHPYPLTLQGNSYSPFKIHLKCPFLSSVNSWLATQHWTFVSYSSLLKGHSQQLPRSKQSCSSKHAGLSMVTQAEQALPAPSHAGIADMHNHVWSSLFLNSR